MPPSSDLWVTLIVGNTRLHWGLFEDQTLLEVCHTPHLVTAKDVQALISSGFDYLDRRRPCALWVASVVPEQTAICLESPIACRVVERSRIPLINLYATLGIDRAVNLLGAKARVGWPVVVIDAGTALTFTAGYDLQKGEGEQAEHPDLSRAAIYGGAILAGIRLQAEALKVGTAALEEAAIRAQDAIEQNALPLRWANDTEGAIASGLVYGAIATIADMLSDWWQRFPNGKAVLTGGDGPQLHRLLQQKTPAVAARVSLDSELMFYGMSAYRQGVIERS